MKTSLHRRAADTDFESSTDARPSISSSIGAPGPSHLGTWESTNRKAGHAAGSRASFFDKLRAGSVQLASVKWHRFPGIASGLGRPGREGHHGRERYNPPKHEIEGHMNPGAVRRKLPTHVLLLIMLVGGIACAQSPTPSARAWDQPAAKLTVQIADLLGPGPVHLSIRNLSSIPTDEFPPSATRWSRTCRRTASKPPARTQPTPSASRSARIFVNDCGLLRSLKGLRLTSPWSELQVEWPVKRHKRPPSPCARRIF